MTKPSTGDAFALLMRLLMSHTAEYNLVYPGANFVLVDVEYRSGAFGFLAGTEVGKDGVYNPGLCEWCREGVGGVLSRDQWTSRRDSYGSGRTLPRWAGPFNSRP